MQRLTWLVVVWIADLALVGIGTRRAEAKSLFNGMDLAGWHADVPELDANPSGK
jgi:hypothetical protein